MQLRSGKQIASVGSVLKPQQASQKEIKDLLNNEITAFSKVQSNLSMGHVERLNEEIKILFHIYQIIDDFDVPRNPYFASFMKMVFIKSPEFHRDILARITPVNKKYKTMTIADRKAAENMLFILRKYM